MKKAPPILVIDDSLTQLAVLRDALETRGYSVATAQNGMEAIGRVYQSPPSLILSDVMMPELNGYHLCRLLKNDPYTAHIPIILLTNLKERHDRFWGEKAGADCYLEKGADLRPILEAVDSLLGSAPPGQPRPISSPYREFNSGDILGRITSILDRLLYESTISNEILKLTALAHNPDLLARELLEFLSVISHHEAAGLLLKEGRDKYLLAIHSEEPVPQAFAELAKKEIFRQAGLPFSLEPQVRLLLLAKSSARQGEAEPEYHILHSLPIADDQELLASITLFNFNRRQLSEGTLHAMNVVAERFLIVMRYLKKLKEIEEVKGDFVSMLVHDLRSPLTSIRGFTDVLAGGILGSVTEEQESALKNIQSGCDRLLLLIEDILDLSKLEAGKMQIHPSPLQILPLAERVIADLSALFLQKSLDVRLDIETASPLVLGDEKQLARVLSNLLTNAVKFTPQGGHIILSAGRQVSSDAGVSVPRLQIDVRDTGSGIPLEEQKRLFNRYQQLPSARMFRKGTGLGLAICKEIICLHGGDIWVESPVDKNGGSRFSFTLPLAPR